MTDYTLLFWKSNETMWEASQRNCVITLWNMPQTFRFSFLLFLLLLSEVLSTKDRPVKASLQTRGYFNPGSQAALPVCCLTENVFKEIQWGVERSMKMMSRNISISSPLSRAYPSFCVGSWAGAKQSRIPKNFPPYLLTGVSNDTTNRPDCKASHKRQGRHQCKVGTLVFCCRSILYTQ